MIKPTILTAIALIVVGVIGYLSSTTNSPTALIPSVLGLLMAISAFIGASEKRRALGMHMAAVFALIGLAGAAMRLPKSAQALTNTDSGLPLAFACQAMMALACALYLILAIRSFAQARRWKNAQTIRRS